MFVRQVADNRGRNGLEQREQASEGSAQEHDVVSRIDRLRKGLLVGVEIAQDAGEQRVLRVRARLAVAVELEELREEGQDEGEGDLWGAGLASCAAWRGQDVVLHTRSSSKDRKMTLSTFLRVLASTAAILDWSYGGVAGGEDVLGVVGRNTERCGKEGVNMFRENREVRIEERRSARIHSPRPFIGKIDRRIRGQRDARKWAAARSQVM